jgi:1-acyl-sn-glycerol-3-phosphate acyltransferase
MKKIIFVIRSLISSVFFAISVIIVGSTVIFITLFSSNKWIQNSLIGLWSKFSLFLFGIKVSTESIEKIPTGSCLLMFNHTSHFDIIAIQSIVPRVRFGAKIELFSIPIFGLAMRRSGVLPIARSKIDEVKKVYQEAQSRTEGGECFALAPEGTRQEQEVIGSFKSGPFIFAINAGIPIVPVLVKGCHQAYPKQNWLPATHNWSEKVSLVIGDPISVEKGNLRQKQELQERVHAWMVQTLEEKNKSCHK